MEKNTVQLDELDRQLLELLQTNAKRTIKEMAEQLHLSTTPVFERIKRLEKEGYIDRYVAVLNRKKVGLGLLVMCDVSLKEHNLDYIQQFETAVLQLKEVMECYHIAGAFDYLLKVVVTDMDAYQRFVKEKLATLDNIGRVQSYFVMTEVKSSTSISVHP
ncbi:MAG: Lrp/AsnC family transcriptional regulator [Chitinophagales bacterium]